MKRRKLFTSFLVSVVTMMLCLVSFAGTTLAWFTDTVSNTGNKIQAGTLDVELWQDGSNMTDAQKAAATEVTEEGYTNYYDISDSTVAAFNYDKWEPGYSTPVSFAIVNNGNLTLKYQLSFYITESLTGLQVAAQDGHSTVGDDVFDHLTKCNANSYLEDVLEVYSNGTKVGTLKQVIEDASLLTESSDVLFAKGDTEHPGGWIAALSQLVVKMPETAGNEYENAKITFDIRLLATQKNYEKDGFNNPDYDEFADETPDSVLPSYATSRVENDKPTTFVVHGDNIAKDAANNTTIEFPAGALTKQEDKDGDAEVEIVATPILTANKTFTVESDNGAVGAIDLTVTVDGEPVSSFNNQDVIVTTYIAKGLTLDNNPNKVGVEYAGTGEQPTFISYNSGTGELKFKTKHFSRFLIDADQVFYIEEQNKAYNSDKFNTITQLYGGHIYLLKDYTFNGGTSYAAAVMKNTVLDLNGYDMNFNGKSIGLYLYKTCDLTIKDSSPSETNKLHNAVTAIMQINGNLVIDNASIEGSDEGIYSNNGSITINDGYISGTGWGICLYPDPNTNCILNINDGCVEGGIATSGNNNTNNATMNISGGLIDGTIYKPDGGTLNISGGTFNGWSCVYVKGGTLNVSGGNFISTEGDGDWKHEDSGLTGTGDAIIVEGCNYPAGNPYVNITGGTFKGYKEEGGTEPTSGNIYFKNYGILAINYAGNNVDMSGTTVPYQKAVVASNEDPNFLTVNGYLHFTDDNTTPITPSID